MTIGSTDHWDGWVIAPQYRSEPVKLVRSPKMQDISKLFDDKKPPRTK